MFDIVSLFFVLGISFLFLKISSFCLVCLISCEFHKAMLGSRWHCLPFVLQVGVLLFLPQAMITLHLFDFKMACQLHLQPSLVEFNVCLSQIP